jgi:hypothetical protein
MARSKPFARVLPFCIAALCLPALLYSATISGTVKDPSGGLVPNAAIQISGPQLAQPVILTSDAQGHFVSPDLPPGNYGLRATAEGFDVLARSVELADTNLTLDLQLAVASTRQEVTVSGKGLQFANTDPVYRQLRTIGLGVTVAVEKFAFQNDVGRFFFDRGAITFLVPVNGVITGAIFIGQGHFSLRPFMPLDTRELVRRIKAESVEEDFTDIVFRFSPGAHALLLRGAKGEAATPPAAAAIFRNWQQKVRQRHEIPLSFSDNLFNGDYMDNIDAELLASLYNPARPPMFEAFIHGAPYKDLRFIYKARGGALTNLDSPEEIALVNDDPNSLEDGVWYLSHTLAEFQARTLSSLEDKRFASARKYKIETAIANNDHLTSVATIDFTGVVPNERVIRFRLLPNLRVARVTDAGGKDLYYIQEGRHADGSFYVILPQPAELGVSCSITIEYSGDKVLTDAGNGSFYVRAREAWYPALNSFTEHSLYDLTFRVPKRFKLISVGALDRDGIEDNYYVSHWVTPKPIAVAGFNYGDYQHINLPDPIDHYQIEGYYLPELPANLARFRESALSGMAPKSMTRYALEQTRAQLQVCTLFFGHSPFDRIYITEQPDFAFGQSWPNLVYLPISAYIDDTQRWLLFGHINNSFTAFVQEVTPHEVAHQWWGHAVGWASYHDQWLSEGFAEFSAALFIQQATGKEWHKEYVQFWERLRKRIVEKNQWGISPNDAGPIWLGERLVSPRTGSAYQSVTYCKGAYILAMIRSILYSNQDGDKNFIALMHEFVDTYRDSPASTESFKAVVDKHVTKPVDLQRNGRLDWFFDEWVYGTDIPHYDFDYQMSPGEQGKTKLHMVITQSGVSNSFAMLVPVFADFGKGFVRLGQLPVVGNSSRTYDTEIPAQPKKLALNAYKEILER